MRTSVFITILSTFIFFNCQKHGNPVQPPENVIPSFSYSHDDSVEGSKIALWYDGGLLVSDTTKSRLMCSLKYIRQTFTNPDSQYPAAYYVVVNRFVAPWVIGELSVGFDSLNAIQVRNHQYLGWNTLPVSLRPDSISMPNNGQIAFLGFNEPYNPVRLAEYYKTLPGVLWAEPNYDFFLSGAFPMYPGMHSGEMSYVFVETFGATIPGPYLYYQFTNGKPTFVGQWSGGPRPWGSDVQESIDSFSVWKGY